ncbi:hypothetical protein JCM11641_004454 [Rhodosporidiobolus odoratus]
MRFSSSELPALPLELINAWTGIIRNSETDPEDRELVLKALRCCRFTENQDLVLRSALPLFLDPSPSLRLQAAGCVLQYLSSAPAVDAKLLSPSLLSTLTRALAPLLFQLPSAPSSTLPRLASTLFRILSCLLLKVSSLPVEHTATIATVLSTWIYHGQTAAAGAASPAPSVNRGRTPDQGHLAFGVMSAFGQPRSPQWRPRQGSDASMTSRASSMGRKAGSGTEDEEGQPRDRRRESAQIRLDALACLRNLAQTDTKALHKHWPLFLSDSPYLRNRPTLFTLMSSDPSRSVRSQACTALNAMLEASASYLAIAEDRPSKASFTSLSSSVGELAFELHSSLATLLSAPPGAGQTEFRLSLLELAAKLAANAPYGRMQRPIAWTLAKGVMCSIDSPDPDLVIASASTLSIIAARYLSTSSSQEYDWESVIAAAKPLVEEEKPEKVQRAGWNLLASIVPVGPREQWPLFLASLEQNFATSAADVQEAQATFVTSLLRLPLSRQDPILVGAINLLRQAVTSPRAPVRIRACEALSLPALSLSPDPADVASSHFPTDPWDLAVELTSSDPSLLVRNATCRALGLLAKIEDQPRGQQELVTAVRVLLELLDGAADRDVHAVAAGGDEGKAVLDVMGTVWTLANVCDAVQASAIGDVDTPRLLRTAADLFERSERDEKIRTSCLRIFSSLFKLPRPSATVEIAVLPQVVHSIADGLSDSAAKVRWNAAIACSSVLPFLAASCDSETGSNGLAHRLVDALTDLLLSDTSYKARIHAVGALSSVPVVTRETEARATVEKVRTARNRLIEEMDDGKVPLRERGHAELLSKRLDTYLARFDFTGSSAPS